MTQKTSTPGVGLDIGTMNFVACRTKSGTEHRVYEEVKDAYIELDVENAKTLKMSQIVPMEIDDVLVITGEKSFQMANLFKQEVKRPLSKGLIAPGSLTRVHKVLGRLVFTVLSEPYVPNEVCYYSVPANPIDIPGQDVIYHSNLFKKIIEGHGYTPHPMNEAMAIIYSECGPQFSGLALSFGAGLCNIALCYDGFPGLEFSLAAGGGDWIDSNAARATGSTAARMCTLKERGGFSLKESKQSSPEIEAIVVYTKALIKNCIENIADKMRKDRTDLSLSDPIPLVVSGGTTLADGFMDIFNEVLDEVKKTKGFPISISEVRRAKEPLKAVAEGLLILARNEYA